MIAELYYLIYDFLFQNFFNAFNVIFLDFSNVGNASNIIGSKTFYNSIDFSITIVALIFTFLLIGILIFLIYRLIMFIIRRFTRV